MTIWQQQKNQNNILLCTLKSVGFIHCTSLLRHVPVYSGLADVTKKQKRKKLKFNVVQTL